MTKIMTLSCINCNSDFEVELRMDDALVEKMLGAHTPNLMYRSTNIRCQDCGHDFVQVYPIYEKAVDTLSEMDIGITPVLVAGRFDHQYTYRLFDHPESTKITDICKEIGEDASITSDNLSWGSFEVVAPMLSIPFSFSDEDIIKIVKGHSVDTNECNCGCGGTNCGTDECECGHSHENGEVVEIPFEAFSWITNGVTPYDGGPADHLALEITFDFHAMDTESIKKFIKFLEDFEDIVGKGE